MQLQIPKEQAIKILSQRLQELSAYNFNPKVWKDRTILDLKQIFGIFGDQWLQISSIYFDTAIISEKVQKLQEGKQAAAGLLHSYIDFIEEYSKPEIQQKQKQEANFQEQYYNLLQKWNALVPDYNSLMKKYEDAIEQNETSQNEINHLKENTLQLDNVTLKRLWTGVQNLPTIQVVTIISVLIAIIIASFSIGQLVERTGANNELFDLKTENSKLKTDKENLEKHIKQKERTINLQGDSLEHFRSQRGLALQTPRPSQWDTSSRRGPRLLSY